MPELLPDRRTFLRWSAAAAGAAAFARIASASGAASEIVDEVDYIVIGTGPGGAPLAANLAEAGFSVLAIEAGPAGGEKAFYDVPALNLRAATDPAISWDFFVQHYSDPAAHGSQWVAERGGVLYPRASTLGGCTAHNALISMYPNHGDFDQIRDLTGDRGWDHAVMWEHWERMQEWQSFEDNIIALGVRDLLALDDQLPRYYAAALAQLPTLPGYVPTPDLRINSRYNVDHATQGFFVPPSATRDAVRVGPRERLLGAQSRHPDRLYVKTDALVERIVLTPTSSGEQRATAVEFLDAAHAYQASPRHSALDADQR